MPAPDNSYYKQNNYKMKQLLLYTIIATTLLLFCSGCKKTGYGNYPGGEVTPYISIYDVKTMYKGEDIVLTKDNLSGSTSLAAIVISDHSGNNLPQGLLFVQEARRFGQLRGIAINIGADAGNYKPGDSVTINIERGILTKKQGFIQITGISSNQIKKISTVPLQTVMVPVANIIADPERYESTLVAVVDGSFIPLPVAGEKLLGDKTINDGTGNVTLHTNATASFANNALFGRANYYGIVINNMEGNTLIPKVLPRVKEDIIFLSSSTEIAPIIITGFVSDAKGSDANNEYIQLMAVQDINFANTPFSVVTTNNAGASTPAGLPRNGWGTGGLRTYKFNITSGKAAKGTFMYVGGTNMLINGSSSTSIANANWVKTRKYDTNDGDGFGTKTGNLLANSGNAFGIAVFKGTTVTSDTEPVDVIFVGSGGTLYDPAFPTYGYRITSNDLYKTIDLITLAPQPFYRSGNNIFNFPYNASDLGFFNQLGGKFNTTMGRWTQRREQRPLLMDKASPLTFIEDTLSTKLMKIQGATEVEDK